MTSRKFIFLICCWLGSVLLNPACGRSLQLFPEAAKTECPSVVYDFLENYLYTLDSLNRRGEILERKMADDKFVFIEGCVADVSRINESTPFSLSLQDGRSYRVSWMDSRGKAFVSVAFPASYELILGRDKTTLESELAALLSSFPRTRIADNTVRESDLIQLNDSLWRTSGEKYYLEELDNHCLFIKDSSGRIKPFFDSSDVVASFRNLFQGFVNGNGYVLDVRQKMYGFKDKAYRISLTQWLDYVQYLKMVQFIALESELNGALKFLVIAQSCELGFNHILSVTVPAGFAESGKCVMSVKLNTFVPIHNVKDLFQQYKERPKKIF